MSTERRLALVDDSTAVEGDPRLPQHLFEALDGTEVWAQGREWRVEVFSVLPDRTATWLQLRLTGESNHMVTVKLRAGESAAMAIALLASWLAQPTPMPQILTAG